MSKLYLSFLFLGLTALYCPEGEFLPEWKQARYEELTALKGSRKLTYDELSEMFGLELDALAEEEHQARLQRQDEVIFELQSREAQLQAQLQQVKAAQAQDPSGTGNLPYVPTDPATVEQVIDPLGQMGGATDWEQSYAQRIDDLLKQYDEIIQRIANLSKQGVIAKEPYFNAAQALAEGIQDALGALDNHVDGTSGETYRQMLERVKKEGLSFEEKADRAMAQINLTLDTLRAMAFDDVSNIVKTFAGGLEMLPGDIKDFKNTTQIIFGLTDQGIVDKTVDLGDTPSAQAFRQFGMELFRNAQNVASLEDVLNRWRTQVFTDLVKSMSVLQVSGMPDISVVASVLKPMVEAQIKEIVAAEVKKNDSESRGTLVNALSAWQIKKSLDPLFALYGKLSGADAEVLSYVQGADSNWTDVRRYMYLRFLAPTRDGSASVIESVRKSLETLLTQADQLSPAQLAEQRNAVLVKYELTPEDLKSSPVLKELCDYQLSPEGQLSTSLNQPDAPYLSPEFFTNLSAASEVLKDAQGLMDQITAAILLHSQTVSPLVDAREAIQLLLDNKMRGEDGQLVDLSAQEKAQRLEESLQNWELLSKSLKTEIAKVSLGVLPDSLQTKIVDLQKTISAFDGSIDQARSLLKRVVEAANTSPEGVKSNVAEQIKIVLDGLPDLVGTDPLISGIAKPFSDRLVNSKDAINNLRFESSLHELLAQYDAAVDEQTRSTLLTKMKEIYETQNSLYVSIYDAKRDIAELYKVMKDYIYIGSAITPGDFPLLEVPPVTDPKNPLYNKSAMARFGQNLMDYLSPAKLLVAGNEDALTELARQLIFDGEWQKVGDNFALNPYDALIAQRNFDALNLHGAPIDWSNVAPAVLLEIARIWLEPIKDKDAKSLTLKQLQLICESFHQSFKERDGNSLKPLTQLYRNISSNIVGSQSTLDAFKYQCGLGGNDVLASKNQNATNALASRLPFLMSPVMQELGDVKNTYTAWLDLEAGQDRNRVEQLIQNK